MAENLKLFATRYIQPGSVPDIFLIIFIFGIAFYYVLVYTYIKERG